MIMKDMYQDPKYLEELEVRINKALQGKFYPRKEAWKKIMANRERKRKEREEREKNS